MHPPVSARQPRFLGSYVRRVVDGELDTLLGALPAILLDGPKGVGKTSTALGRAGTVRRLDDPAQQAVAQASPAASLRGAPPVLLDEWQRVPAVWDAVKREVDADPSAARFLLTGSAASRADTHSGAGRITTLRMRPLTLPERGASEASVSLRALLQGVTPELSGASGLGLVDYTDEILRSGLPGLQHLDGRPLRAQLDGYIERIASADLREAGFTIRRRATFTAWLRAYAAATATTTSYEKIRDAATSGVTSKPAKTTTLPYIELLTDLRVLDPLPAWQPGHNHLRRLVASPRHHLADPALAARLLGLDRESLLSGGHGAVSLPRDGAFLGALFESLASMSVRVFAQAAEAQVHHLRTRAGAHEVDLIVEADDGRVVAIEVKLAGAISEADVRHLHWLRAAIGPRLIDAIVVSTGPQAYRRPDGVGVVPLALLGP